MPRLRRKHKTRRERTKWDHFGLRSGHFYGCLDSPFVGPGGDFDCDMEMVAEAWSELRDEITQQHIGEKPGTRPWA